MRRFGRAGARLGRGVAAAAALVAIGSVVVVGTGPAGAVTPAEIQGSGSSWAGNAINQWVADVYSQGVNVVYNPDGDAQGRTDFANRVSDFSVTADGYQGTTPTTGVADTSQGRAYAYLPIAAGGTAFPYQIKVDGQQVKTLRLSGQTLAKIFTNQITNWSSPTITKDNNGHALPTLPIVPVVQSEGSGSTEQLTNYFATQYPSIWKSFSGQSGPTEYFPSQGNEHPQTGSNGAMNYITSSEGNGSIGYVEYSYTLSVNYPVAKLENSGGFFTLPTQYNVAIALEQAIINMTQTSPDYLLQTLKNVYVDTDPRTYPLSSYVYMIEPTGKYPKPETKITNGKRQAITDFEFYSICQGQKEIGPTGYSPLPVNLVEAGFGQIQKLQDAAPTISLTNININSCNEPTFVPGNPTLNYLTTIAPMPPSCDQAGSGPCAAGVTPNGSTTPTTPGTNGGSTTTTTSPTSSGGSSTPSSPSSPTSPGGSGGTGGSGSTRSSSGGSQTPSGGQSQQPTQCTRSTTTTTSSTTTTAPSPSTTTTSSTTTTAPSPSTTTTAPCTPSTSVSGTGGKTNPTRGSSADGLSSRFTKSAQAIGFSTINLAGHGFWSHFGVPTPVVVGLLLALFAVPVVIGYRRSKRRGRALP